MAFVRPDVKNPFQIAAFAALVSIGAALLLTSAPAWAALDDTARAEIQHQRGAHALRAGKPEEAIEWLDKALALDPERAESLVLKSRALLELGRADEAEAVTSQLRELQPDNDNVLFLLGLTAYRQQDWISSQRYFEELRTSQPKDPRVRLYLGRTYQELGNDSAAEVELREAARLDPEFEAPAAYRLGILHLQRSETKEAKRQFKLVKELNPDSELANSADLYLKLMSANEPQRIRAWFKLGGAYDSNMTLSSGGSDLIGASGESGIRGSAEIGVNAHLGTWNGLTVRTGFTNYISRHNKNHEYDIQQIRPWMLATYQPLEWLAFDTRFTHERVYRDFASFKVANFVSPAVRIIPKPGWVSRLFFEYEDRSYIESFDVINSRDRDGNVGITGIDQYVPIPNPFSDGLAYFRLGYRFRKENATGVHFDNQSHKPLATLAFALPWDMRLSLDASWERREFRKASVFNVAREILQTDPNYPDVGFGDLAAAEAEGRPPNCVFVPPDITAGINEVEQLNGCAAGDRLDHITQARIRLRKNVGKHVTLEGYYRWVNWASNTQEFDFDRHIVGLAATFRR